MGNLNVKSFASASVSLLVICLFGSGLYNTYFMKFHLSENVFNEKDYTIKASDYPKFAKSYPERRESYRTKKKNLRIARQTANQVVQEVNSRINTMAHIQDELNLKLVEVYNSKLFKSVLKEGQIFGNLTARDGVIDNLEVVFPDDEEIVVHGSEMNGNVFNYYHNSEMYSGLIYQSENQGYMITLVNGPYQGTKMKFESEERREVARALSNDENLDQRLGNPVGDNYYPREEEYAHEVEGLEKNEFKPKELDEEYDAEKQEYREDYRDEYKDDRVKDYEARYDDAEYSS